MKYLVVLIVVLAVLWLARSSRARPTPPPGRSRRAPPGETMVACAHCGVHLPRSEALPGRGGMFCDEAHRLAYERVHRAS